MFNLESANTGVQAKYRALDSTWEAEAPPWLFWFQEASNLRCPTTFRKTCGVFNDASSTVLATVSNLRCPTCGVQPLFERPPEISAFQMSGAGLWHIPPEPTECAICRVRVTHFMYWNVLNDGIHSVVILWSHNHERFCVSCVRSSGPISGIRAPPEPWMPSKFDTVD